MVMKLMKEFIKNMIEDKLSKIIIKKNKKLNK